MSRRRGDWPENPEPLPHPVVDNHTHLETVLRETDEGGWRVSSADDGVPSGRGGEVTAQHDEGTSTTAHGAARRSGSATSRDVLSAAESLALRAHLDRAARVGVTRHVQVGCDLGSIGWTDVVVREHAELLGAVAIHPNEAVLHAGVHEVAPDGLEPRPEERHDVSLDEAIARVEAVARGNDRVRSIGETGLDFFRAGERGRAVQRESFRAHIALAKELDLVLQIHDREAHDVVVEVLEADGAPERTVFHCFSGDAALAQYAAERGWFLSFAGPLTFRANEELRAAARVAGPDRVLLETDAPYLTPHPFRGRPNAPYLAPLTMRTLADVLELDLAEACAKIERTSLDLYGPFAGTATAST